MDFKRITESEAQRLFVNSSLCRSMNLVAQADSGRFADR
jgi:hypothetical protein